MITFGRLGLVGKYLAPLGISIPFTSLAVILAQTFVSAPLYVCAACIGFEGVHRKMEELAYVEGASQWQLFSHVMLPLAGLALLSGVVAVLDACAGGNLAPRSCLPGICRALRRPCRWPSTWASRATSASR